MFMKALLKLVVDSEVFHFPQFRRGIGTKNQFPKNNVQANDGEKTTETESYIRKQWQFITNGRTPSIAQALINHSIFQVWQMFRSLVRPVKIFFEREQKWRAIPPFYSPTDVLKSEENRGCMSVLGWWVDTRAYSRVIGCLPGV